MPFPRRSFLAATGTALAATASQASRAHAATAAEAGGVGRRLAAELTVRKDPVSGATIRQLTDYRAHSNHAYFTYSAWYDGGRKLGFLVQELLRETNTIGSKCSDLAMTEQVVLIKVELEKIREQVLNLA